MQRLIPVLLLGLFSAACSTTKAATPIERPTLDVPPAPPRIVEAAPIPEPERIEPVPDLAPPVAVPSPAKPKPAPRETRETQKPEPKPETPAAPDPAATAPPAPTSPPPTLRTPATADTAAAERQIRDVLRRARSGLQSIDYQRLNPDRKKFYDEANDFISGAEAEIKKGNFELARSLAGKADQYAKELQQR